MSDTLKNIIFLITSSIFNIVLTVIFAVVLLFVFLSFFASSMDKQAVNYIITAIMFISMILDFVVYKYLSILIVKKWKFDFLNKGFFDK